MLNKDSKKICLRTIENCLRKRVGRYCKEDLIRECKAELRKQGVDEPSVSVRSIQYYLRDLRDMGADISEELDDVKYYRYADPDFSVFEEADNTISAESRIDLQEILNLLAQYKNSTNMQWIEEIRGRLTSELFLDDAPQIIQFEENPDLVGAEYLCDLFRCIQEQIAVRMHYENFKGEVYENVVSPNFLKQYNGRWFLFCTGNDDGKLYNRALDRIKGLEPIADEEFRQSDVDFEEYFDDMVGVTKMEGAVPEDVIFWVSDISAPYVDTKPIYGGQKVVRDDTSLRQQFPVLEGGKFYKMNVIVNYELIYNFLSYGENLIVVSPESLRNHIREKIDTLEMRYK